MKIDAHQHFWRYNPEEYGWIGPELSMLRRDFLPPDLAPLLEQSGVGGSVSATVAANLTGQPVLSVICSRVTPGWIEVTVISLVDGSGSKMQRSVMSRVGPLVFNPSRVR